MYTSPASPIDALLAQFNATSVPQGPKLIPSGGLSQVVMPSSIAPVQPAGGAQTAANMLANWDHNGVPGGGVTGIGFPPGTSFGQPQTPAGHQVGPTTPAGNAIPTLSAAAPDPTAQQLPQRQQASGFFGRMLPPGIRNGIMDTFAGLGNGTSPLASFATGFNAAQSSAQSRLDRKRQEQTQEVLFQHQLGREGVQDRFTQEKIDAQNAQAMARINGAGFVGQYNKAIAEGIIPQGTSPEEFSKMMKPPQTVFTAESAGDKSVNEGAAKMYDNITNLAANANDMKNSLDVMSRDAQDPNFYSGPLADPIMRARKLAISMHLADPNSVASMEEFSSQAKKMVLNAMGGSLGAQISNSDRDYVDAQFANLDTSPGGIQRLLGLSNRVADRQIAMGNEAANFLDKNGGHMDYKFRQHMNQWSRANPLASPDEKKNTPQGAPAEAPASATPANGNISRKVLPDGTIELNDQSGKTYRITPDAKPAAPSAPPAEPATAPEPVPSLPADPMKAKPPGDGTASSPLTFEGVNDGTTIVDTLRKVYQENGKQPVYFQTHEGQFMKFPP